MAMQLDPAMLQGPIPGQSLTKPPGDMPWETPPELSTIEEVIDFYTEKLMSAETEDFLLLTLDEGMSVERIAEFLSTSGTMNGRHSLDLAFLIDPYIRELIRYVADSADVDYIDSYEDREKKNRIPYRQMREVVREVFTEKPGILPEALIEIEGETPKGLMSRLSKEEE